MWTFRKIELGDVSEVLVYKQAMLESKSTMDGTNGLHVHSHPKTYIRLCIENEQGKQIPSHLVKNTQFVCVDENNHIIGMCNVRHELNELLFNLAGHIGYSVHPSYRRQGVATFMLSEALNYCDELKLKDVLVTCLESNIASKKTILKCGGIYEKTIDYGQDQVERYWFKRGE